MNTTIHFNIFDTKYFFYLKIITVSYPLTLRDQRASITPRTRVINGLPHQNRPVFIHLLTSPIPSPFLTVIFYHLYIVNCLTLSGQQSHRAVGGFHSTSGAHLGLEHGPTREQQKYRPRCRL